MLMVVVVAMVVGVPAGTVVVAMPQQVGGLRCRKDRRVLEHDVQQEAGHKGLEDPVCDRSSEGGDRGSQ
jgi:hypothetical protein